MRGLAYIINSPIPGKTCFKLTSRHRTFQREWKKEKKMIFTSFLWQFPSDDTVSVDSHLHYSLCLFTLFTPSFCFRQELVPSPPTLRVFYFEIQLYTVYCQCSMCWVSKLLLLSYYCGNVCLSLPCQRWPFAWPADRLPGTAVVFFCPGPQYFSFQRREESLKNLWWIFLTMPLLCLCQVSPGAGDGHNEW